MSLLSNVLCLIYPEQSCHLETYSTVWSCSHSKVCLERARAEPNISVKVTPEHFIPVKAAVRFVF